MWIFLGVGVDLIHAFAMAAWLAGFPLLFLKRWPRARLAYATYAVAFIILSQGSMLVLGECFFTALTRWCWHHDPTHLISNEWFTERLARAVFGMAPPRPIISHLSEALVLATAVGVLLSIVHSHRLAVLHTSPR